MKLLSNLFLWFCAATIVAQISIVVLSFLRGNIDKETVPKIVATLNGIDIQGQRLRNLMIEAKDTPVPSHEEILKARAQMSLELDARERALSRLRDQLDTMRTKFQIEVKEFDARRVAFEDAVANREKTVNDQTLGEVQRIIEILPPEQAKDQIMRMMTDNSTADVVAIVKALPDDKRKKIIGEFVQPEEAEKLHQILGLIRAGVEETNPTSQANLN